MSWNFVIIEFGSLLSFIIHVEFVTDLALEYEEGETYNAYKEFYEDVYPEFRACGRIVMFKVCCNYEPHLRGNVYIEYER